MKALGIMSGTSLDGITIALIEADPNAENLNILHYKTYPYSDEVKNRIKEVSEHGVVDEVSNLNYELGVIFSHAVSRFLTDFGIDFNEIFVIGLHGQTIYHNSGISTLQIGEPSFIAIRNHIDVVSNFRSKDIVLGGTGAPLIPYFDFLYFRKFSPVALVNLGGISNITFVPDNDPSHVIAFDMGPCNMVLDKSAQVLFGVDFDKDGAFAMQGKINDEMLDYLKNNEYILKKPPKSAGRSEFGDKFFGDILEKFGKINKFDFIATLNMFVAYSIAYSIKNFINSRFNLLVLSGGGAKNKTLVENIKRLLNDFEVKHSDNFGIPSEAKEAVAFGVYAIRSKLKLKSHLPQTTGSKSDYIMGSLTYGE
ncbi:anhydro-N-acetylmuramic acid kinase [Caldisericum exile]|uniref:Anhydro-N-acetylmuramic acid kinase n=1 Tax=Caldisericum exile (strain DSM 21853 / NBRC 104410 / AZM16c01) TaxID=511051 RepID=A0A7U6GDL5_CALEA|nr:anhydro-N-acetylmuramic acid kinase [Caldisericum exile]BAL80429.1 anhydro-N-acetylmuramic acid kinase [Caldisericum exile AZM16c01]